jgi:hypothetical protein
MVQASTGAFCARQRYVPSDEASIPVSQAGTRRAMKCGGHTGIPAQRQAPPLRIAYRVHRQGTREWQTKPSMYRLPVHERRLQQQKAPKSGRSRCRPNPSCAVNGT